jgi:DNA-binding transcriptional ArsR family regulator
MIDGRAMIPGTKTDEHDRRPCSNLKDENKAEELVRILKSLGNERRLRIVCALTNGERSVGELGTVIDASQSLLSQHLAILRRNGIVRARPCAQRVYYSLSPAVEPEIRSVLQGFSCGNVAGDSDTNSNGESTTTSIIERLSK